MNIKILTKVFGMLLLTGIFGCATIPLEAPELSAELGKRISAIEDANITLLHRFFDEKKEEVDRFIEEEWIPLFAEEVFSHPKIAEMWDIIVAENNKQDRLIFLIKTGPKLQQKINEKRNELIKPLDDLEKMIEKKIRDEYAMAREINNSITTYLMSASKVTESRKKLLEKVGVKEEEIGKLINETDDAVTDLLKKTKNIQEKIDGAAEYLDKIKSITGNI